MGSAHPRRRLALGAGLVAAALAATGVLIPTLIGSAAADTAPITVLSSDFEDGTAQSWAPRGTVEVVANSTTVAHAGTHSLSITGRTATWNGPTRDLLSTAQIGVRYTFSLWARMASTEASTALRMSVERRSGTTTNYDTVVNSVTVDNNGWTQLTGSYTLAATVDYLTVYVESVSGTPAFFIDDFSMSYVPPTAIQTGIPSLKTVFADDFTMGAAVSPATLLNEHGQLLTKHFGSLTPGNSLKWDATEPTENTFRYTDADTIVDFATANGMKVRGHTLVWHNQTPAWVFQDASGATMTATAANKTLLLSRLQNHITNVMGRYKGKIGVWDVANEVLNEDGTLRNSTWYQITGLDYLRTAFTTARAVDPAAQLCINDYNLTVAAKRDGMYNLVSQLRGEGIPIDCIGSQMHSNIAWPSVSDTTAMIQKFAALGVDQQITEMDVSVYTDSSSTYTTIPDVRADHPGSPVQGVVRRVRRQPGVDQLGDAVGPGRRRHLAVHLPDHPAGGAAALRSATAGQARVLVGDRAGVPDRQRLHQPFGVSIGIGQPVGVRVGLGQSLGVRVRLGEPFGRPRVPVPVPVPVRVPRCPARSVAGPCTRSPTSGPAVSRAASR